MINNKKIKQLKIAQLKIKHYRDALFTTYCPFEKLYLENQLLQTIDYALDLITELREDLKNLPPKEQLRESITLTLPQLSTYNGMNGKPAYVAVDGIIYDVSQNATWGGASHFGLFAGKDLSSAFHSCHKNAEILSKLPKVGVLK